MNKATDKTTAYSPMKVILWAGLVLLIVLNLSGVLALLNKIFNIFYPLLLGAALAYIFNIFAASYEKIYFPVSNNTFIQKTRRGTIVILTLLTVILILALLMWVIIPQFAESTRLLIAGFPAMYDNLLAWLERNSHLLPGLQQQITALDMNGEELIKKGFSVIGNWAFGTFSLIGSFFSKIATFLLAAVFGIYLLFGKEQLQEQWQKLTQVYLQPERRDKLSAGLKIADEAFSSYIIGQIKEAIILGVLCTLGMLILGLPYAFTIGSVVGLTALIPLVGAYIGAGLGFLLIVMVNPIQAWVFILFIIILQQIESNLIYPRVVGNTIGLPGIWVFASIIIGGGLLGVIGILLGVPVAAVIYKLLARDIYRKTKPEDLSVEES